MKTSNEYYMNPKTLESLAAEIAARGNDMEVRTSKDGLKVFEVKKKLIKIIQIGEQACSQVAE